MDIGINCLSLLCMMQSLITKYLFQNGHCPLPSLGELEIGHSSASANFMEKQLTAPQPFIKLNKETPDASGLVQYIAAKAGKPQLDAEDELFNFCKEIKGKVNNGESVVFSGVGKFFKDSSGQLSFDDIKLPAAYFPPVYAERVVHADAAHTMKVGDTETTNTEMEAWYAEEEKPARDRWWIWAVIIGTLSLAASVIHFYKNPAATGNQIRVELNK